MYKYDPDRAATTIRMVSSGKMITQGQLSEKTGIDRNFLNAFLRRRINLLDSDIEKLFKILGPLDKFETILSSPVNLER